jgi:hypothetical protein
MQIRMINAMLKSSTVVETIVALLVLMISFSAGMVIYNKVLISGVNAKNMRNDNELVFLMDSLVTAAAEEPARILRPSGAFESSYLADERFPGLLLMEMKWIGTNGVIVAKRQKWIRRNEED